MSQKSRHCQKKITLLAKGQNEKSKTYKSCLNILPLICIVSWGKNETPHYWGKNETLNFQA
jgi:hypothetical protein